MNEQLVTFETAKLAKDKGFDFIDVHSYYHINEGYSIGYALCISEVNEQTDGCLLAPTQSLLQKWLRDREENIIIVIPMRDFHRNYNGWYYEVFTQLTKKDKPVLMISSDENFDTYEEALEIGLQEALKLI